MEVRVKTEIEAELRTQTHIFVDIICKNWHSWVIRYNYRRIFFNQKLLNRGDGNCMVWRLRWMHMLAMSLKR